MRNGLKISTADLRLRERRIERLHAQGHSLARIAAAIGTTERETARELGRVQRADHIIALRKGGATLEEIAAVVGVSRERVRQIEAQYGGTIPMAERDEAIDVLRALRLIRQDPAMDSWNAVQRRGFQYAALRDAMKELGLFDVVARLFRIRAGRYRRSRRAHLIETALRLQAALGREPTIREIAREIYGKDCGLSSGGRIASEWAGSSNRRIGTLPEFRAACGFRPRTNLLGIPRAPHGTIVRKIRELAARPEGIRTAELIALNITTRASAHALIQQALRRGELRVRERLTTVGRPAVYELVQRE